MQVARAVHALDPDQLDVTGGRRARDEGVRPGRVQLRERVGQTAAIWLARTTTRWKSGSRSAAGASDLGHDPGTIVPVLAMATAMPWSLTPATWSAWRPESSGSSRPARRSRAARSATRAAVRRRAEETRRDPGPRGQRAVSYGGRQVRFGTRSTAARYRRRARRTGPRCHRSQRQRNAGTTNRGAPAGTPAGSAA